MHFFPLHDPRPLARFRPGSAIKSIATVNQQLANGEGRVSVQLTRIAQLQTQLDVVLAAHRRSPSGVHV